MSAVLCFSCCSGCCSCKPRRYAVSPVAASSRVRVGYHVSGCLLSMMCASRVRHTRNRRNSVTVRVGEETGGATGETRPPRARLLTFFFPEREKGEGVERLSPSPLMGPSTANSHVGSFGRVVALAGGVGNSPVFSPVSVGLVRRGCANACTSRHRPGSDGPLIAQGGS